MEQKTMLSGIQTTGVPHIGNYLGAIRNWVHMQNEYRCIILGIDLHALTVPQDPETLRENSYQMFAYLIACGLEPEKCLMFLQSHVPQHAELNWILTCFTYMGELSRMIQFKEKGKKQGKTVGVGLFAYPILQAADILLYHPHFIPVGEDQKQHIELTRNLAERLNNRFKRKLFTLPGHFLGNAGSRIMDLQNPTAKMSKSSDSLNGVILLNDTDKQMAKKIKTAITDSGTQIGSKNGVGIENLLETYSALSGKPAKELLGEYRGKLYGNLKVDLADLVVSTLGPIRDKAQQVLNDRTYIDVMLRSHAAKAREIAGKTLADVYDAIGLLPLR